MPAPRKYSDELRERAVRMVEEALREDPRLAHKRACSQVGERLGIPGGTIRNWIRQGVAGGRAPLAVTVTDDPAGRIAQLERENRELRRANAILKSASAFFRRSCPPLDSLIAYIDSHKEEFGVEPICAVLSDADAKIAPSTYYAAVARPPSKRAVADGELDERITELFDANYGVYGVQKMWKALNRQVRLDEHGHPADEPYPGVARCTVARRMKALGLTGAVAGDHKRARTTIPGRDHRPEDSLNRDFTAQRPNQRWVADITYVPTWCGFVYVAFVLDLYARRIVGWRVASTLRTDLALDALEHGIWTRQQGGHDLSGLIHHSDRGVQYLSIRYTERLDELGITASVGSKGDSYDNAAAEALNRLFKTEVIHRLGPWRTLEHVEFEVLKWVDWYNQHRPHSWCGDLPPIKYENIYYAAHHESPTPAVEHRLTLH